MKIQFVSDIHLEFRKTKWSPNIPKLAPIIALLGDIGKPRMGNYKKLIETLSAQFEHVLVIAGNHEYYSSKYSYEATNHYMHQYFLPFENVYFLDNSSITIDGIRFIGSTLWSNIHKNMEYNISISMNDYKKIKTKPFGTLDSKTRPKPITPFFTNQKHQIAVKYIEDQLDSDPLTPTVILTHHLPLNNSEFIPKQYQTESTNSAYFSDLSDLVRFPVIVWLFGHCHEPIDYTYKKIILKSNPMGYPDQNIPQHLTIEL